MGVGKIAVRLAEAGEIETQDSNAVGTQACGYARCGEHILGAGEAMACGVPLISTHSGGLEEVVGDAALKIMPSSAEEIEKAVIKLFNNPEDMRKLSIKGRQRIEEIFDWKIAASSYESSFKAVIESFINEYN